MVEKTKPGKEIFETKSAEMWQDLDFDMLKEQGDAVAEKLTEAWEKLSEEQKKESTYSAINGFEGDAGKAFFEELIADKAEMEELPHEQKMNVLQALIDKVEALKNDIEKRLEDNSNFDEEVRSRAAVQKEEIAEETEKISEKLGHELPKKSEENLHETPAQPQSKEITSAERHSLIEEKIMELEDWRNIYLNLDYEKNTAYKRIGKFFKGIGRFSEDKRREQDAELAEYRARYDNKLFDLQKLLIEDAKERGASDKELADLFIEFRTEQKITLAKKHDQVKIDRQEGTAKGWMKEKVLGMTDWYRKLPLGKKLAISGVLIAGGWIGAGAGTAAVTTVASAAFLRRMLGSMSTGVGVTLGLEAKGKMKDKSKVEKERELFLKQLENLSEEDKYKLLSGSIKDVAIKDEENTIDKVKNQDIRQMTAGALVGTFIGSGMMGHMLSAGYHEVVDHFKGFFGHAKDEIAAKLLPSHGPGIAPHERHMTVKISEPFKDSHGHVKHDSFWRSLKNHIGETKHFDKADLDHVTELTFHDAAKEYANNHGISYEEAVKKLSRIHPGTTYELTFDSNGTPHMHINDDNVKFMKEATHHGTGHGTGHGVNRISEGDKGVDMTPKPTAAASQEAINKALDAREHARIVDAQDSFNSVHKDYVKAVEPITTTGVADSEIMSHYGAMSETTMQHSAETIRGTEVYRKDFNELAKKALLSFKENNGRNLLIENRDIEYSRAIADKDLGPKLKAFGKEFSKMIKSYVKANGGTYVPTLRPEDGETVERYMQRVILRTVESKYGILRG